MSLSLPEAPRGRRLTAGLFLLLTIVPGATVPGAKAREPTALSFAQEISFAQGVDSAWAEDPERTELETNVHSANARADAARSWFAGGPTLNAEYFDDHAPWASNVGYTTYQGGVSVPLWLPGQGSATVSAARAEADSARERAHVARMAVAAKLLDASAEAIIAQRRLGIAHVLEEALARIDAAVARGAQAGETTRADAQAVEAERAAAASERAIAQEQVTTALSALRLLLGRPGVPDILAYDARDLSRAPLAASEAAVESDPRIRAARQTVRAADENVRVARDSFMPNPEVGVAAIHEKQYGSPWDDRVGVTLSVPLPSDVRNVPMLAEARNKRAAAATQETLARRAVMLELAKVTARVTAARAALADAVTSAEAMNARAIALTHSWELGETPLIEALRARIAACRALETRNEADVAWHAAVIRALISAGAFQ